MIKLDANPYLGEFEEYFNKRSLNMCLNQQMNNIRLKLAKRQKGMCPICNQFLTSQYGDVLYELEMHHIIPVVSGGTNILKIGLFFIKRVIATKLRYKILTLKWMSRMKGNLHVRF